MCYDQRRHCVFTSSSTDQSTTQRPSELFFEELTLLLDMGTETFLAIHHTCLSLADCASYLLDTLGFTCVLLSHLQSEAIESRFGWLRQLSAASYFISMKQVLDSDRKIRALSLLKFSGLSVKDIDDAIHTDQSAADSAADSIADHIADALVTTNVHWPSSSVIKRCQHHILRQ